MSGIPRYSLIALVCILALLILVPVLMPADTIRRAAEKMATEAVGMPVKIARLSLRILPVPGASLRGLKIEDIKGGAPLAEAARARVAVAIAPILHGRVELTGITFRHVALRISGDARGKGAHMLRISKASGRIKWSGDRLDLPNWNVRLHGGTVRINTSLSPLTGKRRMLKAVIHAENIHVKPLLADITGNSIISGILSSRLKISAMGETDEVMRRNLRVEGPVRLVHGTINAMKMESVAERIVLGSKLGKAIIYDSLALTLRMRGQVVRLDEIELKSTRLNAMGYVKIAADGKISGEIQTSGAGGVTAMKLIMTGTADHPGVYPATSSLSGIVTGAGGAKKPLRGGR